jgi:hypothetical protein
MGGRKNRCPVASLLMCGFPQMGGEPRQGEVGERQEATLRDDGRDRNDGGKRAFFINGAFFRKSVGVGEGYRVMI